MQWCCWLRDDRKLFKQKIRMKSSSPGWAAPSDQLSFSKQEWRIRVEVKTNTDQKNIKRKLSKNFLALLFKIKCKYTLFVNSFYYIKQIYKTVLQSLIYIGQLSKWTSILISPYKYLFIFPDTSLSSFNPAWLSMTWYNTLEGVGAVARSNTRIAIQLEWGLPS